VGSVSIRRISARPLVHLMKHQASSKATGLPVFTNHQQLAQAPRPLPKPEVFFSIRDPRLLLASLSPVDC
jgi:hypothetical protein